MSLTLLGATALAQRFARYFISCLSRVFMPPSKYEAMFVSAAHSDADINYTAECIDRALATMAGE